MTTYVGSARVLSVRLDKIRLLAGVSDPLVPKKTKRTPPSRVSINGALYRKFKTTSGHSADGLAIAAGLSKIEGPVTRVSYPM